mgnify:CR=1 FL=1
MVVYDFKNVVKLKKLKNSEKVLPKHAEKISDISNGLFKEFKYSSYKETPPYPNESIRTLQELIKMVGANPNDEFIYSMDRITESFEKLCSELEIPFDETKIEEILEEASGVILDLKYHFNRPRPLMVAELYGLDLEENELHIDTKDSPSFPSGHHSIRLKKLGRDIGKSRVIAKVHYPSDIVVGERLGNDMFQHLKENNLL